MILKNHLTISRRQFSSKFLKWLGVFALIATLVASIYSIIINRTEEGIVLKESDFTLIANAEVVKDGKFVLGKHLIKGGYQQSTDFFFEGKHSIKLGADVKYGFSTIITDIKPGDQLIAQVWMHSPLGNRGCVTINSLDKKGEIYVQGCSPISEKNGWQLLQVIAKVSAPIKDNSLKIYCYTNGKVPIYFDKLSYLKTNKTLSTWKPDEIKFVIKEDAFKKLELKRSEALDQGMLLTTEDSWVNGNIFPKAGEEKIKVSMRLKGDWLDHLEGDKWSFRVKTQTDKSWNRLKTFSLQDPMTRSYLKEWVLHQFFDYEDILTTRYEFVQMKLNNKDWGLYAYEEHFLKQIPEFNKRREGPIIKFTENGLWEARVHAKKLGVNIGAGEHRASPDVRPFGENKVLNADNLAQQYKIAQNLAYEYQFGLKKAKDIFELDLMAKYYAIMDVTAGHHGVIWHNQRFYYNPVIGKLEPIGFDGYDKYGTTWVQNAYLGCHLSVDDGKAKDWHAKMFMEPDFIRKYVFYLDKFSQKGYVKNFVNSIQQKISDRLVYIQSLHPGYRFSSKYLYANAAAIQEGLMPTSASIHNRTVKPGLVAVCNKHNMPIEIIGTTATEEGTVTKLDSPALVYITVHFKIPDFSKQIEVPANAKFLVYQVLGLDTMHRVAINPWPVPRAYTPMQELQGNLVDNHSAYYYDKEQKKVIFKDTAIIATPIIIPQGHSVKIEAGCRLDIIKKAFVISYSAVHFMGEEEQPILVNSSDGTANGFTVLQAEMQSKVNYTTFSNMNTLAYKGWNLTGAVTFYESDVEIRNSIFTQNKCEDALNIIRSEFLFHSSTVSNTFADGFDADFCIGDVLNSYFYKTGNDGIDFSTSNIHIEDTKIIQAGDKGISIGEEGKATVVNTLIDGAVIGIASKDFSKVFVKSCSLKNCGQGFAAYQKKPEYGGGIIMVDKYEAEKVPTLYKIFPGSYLKLIDKEIKGD